MSLVWTQEMSLSNNAMDEDHRRMFDLVNKIEVCLLPKDEEKLASLFDDLMELTEKHFLREEKFATKVDFPDAGVLFAEHEALLIDLEAYKQETSEQWSEATISEISERMKTWLVDHITTVDIRMKPYFEKFPPDYVV